MVGLTDHDAEDFLESSKITMKKWNMSTSHVENLPMVPYFFNIYYHNIYFFYNHINCIHVFTLFIVTNIENLLTF